MKRFLVFLLIFAVGLALLLWVQERTAPITPPTPAAPEEPQEPPPGEILDVRDERGRGAQVSTSGPLRDTAIDRATGRPLYRVEARNHYPSGGGVYELEDVHVIFFDEQGDERYRLRAERAQARIEVLPGGGVGLDPVQPVTFQDVVFELKDASFPFVPITARVPVLEGTLGTQGWSSREAVTIEGQGLSAQGRGLEVDGVEQVLRLLDDPSTHVELGGGGRATLSSRGALTIRRRSELGPRGAAIESRGDAHLSVAADEPVEVLAERVMLLGTLAEGDTAAFEPARAEAEGSVRLAQGDRVFEGERAQVEFEADARPRHATLEGRPRFQGVLRDLPADDVPVPLPEGRGELLVRGSGAGPLTVDLGKPLSFELPGPAEVELPELEGRLRARGALSGSTTEADGSSRLVASGGAEVDYPGSHLEAETLVIETLPRDGTDEPGRRSARMTAPLGAHATGALRDGGTFDLEARGRLVAVRTPAGFTVPEAHDVQLTVEGDRPFRARADRVWDLDATTLTFEAEGGVLLEREGARARGVRLSSHGPAGVELFGTETSPARVVFPGGWAEARLLRYVDAERLEGEDMEAALESGEQRFHIQAREGSIEEERPAEGSDGPSAYRLDARGDVLARAEGPGERSVVRADELHAQVLQPPEPGARLEPGWLLAIGRVAVDHVSSDHELHGEGERLEIDADRRGTLRPAPEQRVRLSGSSRSEGLAVSMSAAEVSFSPEGASALNADVEIEGLSLSITPGAKPPATGERVRAVAGRMSWSGRSLVFTEGVYMGQVAPGAESWSLDAEKAVLTASPPAEEGGEAGAGRLRDLTAWGGIIAQLGNDVQAHGDQLQLDRERNLLSIAGPKARIIAPGILWQAEWFEIDLERGAMRASKGTLHPAQETDQEAWKLSYASLEPITTEDELVQVVREPVFTSGARELRAAWALFWVDPREWRRLSREGGAAPRDLPETAAQRPAPAPQSLFGQLEKGDLAPWLREAYLEGNVEVLLEGQRVARADAIYVDRVDGHGWVQGFDMLVEIPLAKRSIKLRAEWLRASADGSYQAGRAVATACEFEEPHYVVEIGDLNMTPRYRERVRISPEGERYVEKTPNGWMVTARNSSLRFFGRFSVPLPRTDFPMTPDYKLDRSRGEEGLSIMGWQPFSFGSDAKLGTFIRAQVTKQLGVVERGIHRVLGGRPDLVDLEGDTTFRGALLKRRGVLGGFGTELRSPGRYWLDIDFDAVFDTGKDRGLIRVDEGDRDDWRLWFRSRGRYLISQTEWIDLVVTRQSDPGVQAEFFEGDFLAYEERENYLHWRRADGVEYAHATLEARLEDFRTEVLEQPSVGFFRGRSKVGAVFDLPLLYTSDSSLAYLVRRDGDRFTDPFLEPSLLPPLPGGADREVLRFDTSQRLEAPAPLGALGLRATPFLEARATAWDEDLAGDDSPTRVGLLAGVDLATTFWKGFANGSRHEWSPSIGVRSDVAVEDTGGRLVQFDAVENPLEGRFVDLGLRSRWTHTERKGVLDVELRQTHAGDVADGQPDGWLPTEVRGQWLSTIASMPFGVVHDARYDLDASETPYSRTFIALQPLPPLELETGYHSARDLNGDALYNAWSAAARYTFSDKWEFEGRETYSTLNSRSLSSSFTVRRYGHDLVFEIVAGFTAGEGGSLRIDLTPLFAFKRKGFSLLETWQGRQF
ncbi:MAG TPA: hypothetical protein VMS76_08995 [Planctomycetota bacterium]|nr:hypothetical protein [Planctomycetota bacterium]